MIRGEEGNSQRRSVRLPGFDYSQSGAYFVTICAHGHRCLFGTLQDRQVDLNRAGKILQECWQAIPNHFPNALLDEFVVMPNHLHGIILLENLTSNVGATHASPFRPGPKPRSIGSIIGSFKAAATKQIRQSLQASAIPIWQRNYHERIVRNDQELNDIRQYILDNPAKWDTDEYHITL